MELTKEELTWVTAWIMGMEPLLAPVLHIMDVIYNEATEHDRAEYIDEVPYGFPIERDSWDNVKDYASFLDDFMYWGWTHRDKESTHLLIPSIWNDVLTYLEYVHRLYHNDSGSDIDSLLSTMDDKGVIH